jgi:very-short-patch-repair endonuclease
MGGTKVQPMRAAMWRRVRKQHGVIARFQLLEFGYSRHGIQSRIKQGRLHRLWPGVYAVGRPDVDRFGRWMAAVLYCGRGAMISHGSAAALFGFGEEGSDIEVSVLAHRCPRSCTGIRVHRRALIARGEVTKWRGIPVTTVAATLIDLAPRQTQEEREEAINQADMRGLTKPDNLRRALEEAAPRPGVGVLRRTLDPRTYVRTRSWLERRFLPLARAAGLPKPQTRVYVNDHEVDFYWPELELVVECDGGTFHRTRQQQNTDRRRDNAHTLSELEPLRFTYDQIEFEPDYVIETLTAAAQKIRRRSWTRFDAAD